MNKFLTKMFRKTSLNKEYYEFCRLTQKYPMIANTKIRYFWYPLYNEKKMLHLGWYCNFCKKYGIVLNVKG